MNGHKGAQASFEAFLARLDRGQIVLSASGAYEAFGLWMSQHRELFSFQREIDE